MKLNEIIIKGFKSKEVVAKISFKNGIFNVLYGKNGVGKTTFMEIIYATFEKNESRLLKENVDSIEIRFNKIEVVRIVKNEYEDFNKYDWSEFDKSQLAKARVMYIGTSRALYKSGGNFKEQALINYFKNNAEESIGLNSSYEKISDFVNYVNGTNINKILKKIKNNENLEIQGITISDIEKIILISIKRMMEFNKYQKLKLKNKVLVTTMDYLASNEIKEDTNNKELELTNEELKLYKEIVPVNIGDMIKFGNIEKYEENLKKHFKRYFFDKLKDNVLEEFYTYTNKKINVLENRLEINYKNDTHQFDKLSHGERHLITLLSLIGYAGRGKALIMIDEPCIALDTDWHQRLLDTFKEISNVPMLIATQSPYLTIDYIRSQIQIDGGLSSGK